MSLPNFINFEPFNALRRKMHTDRMGDFDFKPEVPERSVEKPLKKKARKVAQKAKAKAKVVANKVAVAKRKVSKSKASKGAQSGQKAQG